MFGPGTNRLGSNRDAWAPSLAHLYSWRSSFLLIVENDLSFFNTSMDWLLI